METLRVNGSGRREARKQSLRGASISDAQLAALEKSSDCDMTLRLIKAVREARRERDEAVGTLALERADWAEQAQREVEDNERGADAYDGHERVLVVIYPDGFVELYGERWIDSRIISVGPLEDDGEWVARLPSYYRELALPGKVRGYGQCTVRPTLTDDALATILACDARRELATVLERYLAAREKR